MSAHPVPGLVNDPAAYATELERVHEAVLSGSPAPRSPRSLISESWQRSLEAKIDPDGWLPQLVYQGSELDEVRAEHPLAGVLPLLRQTLVSIADEAMHVMIITDADGHILWREGNARVRARADDVLLTEGTRWSEDSIGTNAMGTTLAVDRPVQIYSAEHLVRTYHEWTCAAAPVHDPDSGRVLGSIDVSGPLETVHPATLALVSTAAQLVDKQLYAQLAAEDERLREKNMRYLTAQRGSSAALVSSSGRLLTSPPAELGDRSFRVDTSKLGTVQLPNGRSATLEPLEEGYLLRLPAPRQAVPAPATPTLRLCLLGAQQPVAWLNGRQVRLSLRHAEILALLAMYPDGMTGEKLAFTLYGDEGNPVTVRAEIHRLRATLGNLVVRTKPYRLAATVDADFLRLRQMLSDGRMSDALSVHTGSLLERSEAPAIRSERAELHAALRGAVLASADPELLWSFGQSSCGQDDLEVFEELRRLLPAGDSRRAVAEAHLRSLLADE